MHGSRKFYQMGSDSDNVFLGDEGRRADPNNTKRTSRDKAYIFPS